MTKRKTVVRRMPGRPSRPRGLRVPALPTALKSRRMVGMEAESVLVRGVAVDMLRRCGIPFLSVYAKPRAEALTTLLWLPYAMQALFDNGFGSVHVRPGARFWELTATKRSPKKASK